MKRKVGIIAVISLVLVSTLLVSVGLAASPGTSGDPLVSKSYVDEKFNQVLSLLSSAAELPVITTPEVAASETAGATYKPVNAVAGQIVFGGEGTEIILRSGKCLGYCAGANGIVDVTDGTEIFNGTEVKANHMLIVPRNDGRGVVVTADAWFIIKGSYTLR